MAQPLTSLRSFPRISGVKFVLTGVALALWFGLAGRAAATPPQELQRRPLPPAITNSIFYKRWLWHRQDRLLPDGRAPDRWRERALEEIRATSVSALNSPELAVPGNAWAPIGPGPIFSGANAASGRIGKIAVNPANPAHWLIGAAQGGIWETINTGATWKAKTDDQPSLAFGAIAFAPGDTNIIYAGTGEEVFSGDAASGAGLLKSSNGGATWQVLAAATFNTSSVITRSSASVRFGVSPSFCRSP